VSKADLLHKKARLKRAIERKAPGPKPVILKIRDDWREAVKKTFSKKKPPNGCPK
jgi:hypothetical protein